jgi:hypothetical protein
MPQRNMHLFLWAVGRALHVIYLFGFQHLLTQAQLCLSGIPHNQRSVDSFSSPYKFHNVTSPLLQMFQSAIYRNTSHVCDFQSIWEQFLCLYDFRSCSDFRVVATFSSVEIRRCFSSEVQLGVSRETIMAENMCLGGALMQLKSGFGVMARVLF